MHCEILYFRFLFGNYKIGKTQITQIGSDGNGNNICLQFKIN